MEVFEIVRRTREKRPLVQCITNFVTVNDCANILLAAGASPTMAMDKREVEEAVEGVQALVCNLGAIEYLDSMILAGKRANQLGIPVILDPVAAGGTSLRREASKKLLEEVQFAVIRGNASEIRGLACGVSSGQGVDVSHLDAITEENLTQSIPMIEGFARQTKAVIAVSGMMDVISDGIQTGIVRNGCETMARVTGSGCMLTTLIGGYCAGSREQLYEATCAAVVSLGVAGELAERKRLENGTGNVTFRTDLIDGIFNLTKEEIEENMKYEIYQR